MSAGSAMRRPRPDSPAPAGAIDWEAIERSPEFRELVRRRRRFVVPATIFFLAWFFGFIVLAGYAPDFMGEKIVDSLTVGYVWALSQFVMVWVLCWLYLRKSDREFDPLAERVVARALSNNGQAGNGPASGRANDTHDGGGGARAGDDRRTTR